MTSFQLSELPREEAIQLNWKDKETPVCAVPQNAIEVIRPFGPSMGQVYLGKSRAFLEHLICSETPKVQLAYLDPPFCSETTYQRTLKLRIHDRVIKIPIKEFDDHWKEEEYLQFLYEHLIFTRELLADNGSIILHCDWHQSHHIRCLLDMVFGSKCFQNEIIFAYGAGGQPKHQFPRKHDSLFWYRKDKMPTFNPDLPIMRTPYDDSTLKSHFRHRDKENRLFRKQSKNGVDYISYADTGKRVNSVWTDIKAQLATSPISTESTGYPTQKPEHLIERLIAGLTQEGDCILDPFIGSGTTAVVASRLKRTWVVNDSNLRAITTSRKRLGNIPHHFNTLNTPLNPTAQAQVCISGLSIEITGYQSEALRPYIQDTKIELNETEWPFLIQYIDLTVHTKAGTSIHRYATQSKNSPIALRFDLLPQCKTFTLHICDYFGGLAILTHHFTQESSQ